MTDNTRSSNPPADKDRAEALETFKHIVREYIADEDHGDIETEIETVLRALQQPAQTQTEAVDGLLPCPFCGSDAEMDYTFDEDPNGPDLYSPHGRCTNCEARGPEPRSYNHIDARKKNKIVRDSVEEARQSWNTRATPPAQAVQIDKCPKCNGPADNGHDRSFPPNPYYCKSCTDGEAVQGLDQAFDLSGTDYEWGLSVPPEDAIKRPLQEAIDFKWHHVLQANPGYKFKEFSTETWGALPIGVIETLRIAARLYSQGHRANVPDLLGYATLGDAEIGTELITIKELAGYKPEEYFGHKKFVPVYMLAAAPQPDQTVQSDVMPEVLYINDPVAEHTGDLMYEGRASRFHARHKYIRSDQSVPQDVIEQVAGALDRVYAHLYDPYSFGPDHRIGAADAPLKQALTALAPYRNKGV